MAEDNVFVLIECEQKVRYCKTVMMTRERWEEIKKVPDREMERDYSSPLGDLFDDHDITDWDDYEDVEMTVVDENGKPVEPEDYYRGGEDDEED